MWLEILIDKSQKTERFITESLQFISTETETYPSKRCHLTSYFQWDQEGEIMET